MPCTRDLSKMGHKQLKKIFSLRQLFDTYLVSMFDRQGISIGGPFFEARVGILSIYILVARGYEARVGILSIYILVARG